jgi:hypothetical protein
MTVPLVVDSHATEKHEYHWKTIAYLTFDGVLLVP